MRTQARIQAGLVAVGAAVVLAFLASRVGGWAVMTDELLYERLAQSIAQTGSPLPALHGEHVDVYAQLYPLLLSPVFALFPMPGAVIMAHAWNGIIFASASIPAYLVARRLVPGWMSVATAVATVAVPWSVISGFLMTEVAAYPAFVWAVFAIQRTVVAPTDGRDLLALVAIAAAALARPQLAVLAVVFPLVALVHELRFGYRFRAHRVLLAACAVGMLVLLAAALTGSLGSLLGSYAPTVEEETLISRAALRSAAVHLDVVAVALAAVPLLLGGGWALETAIRARVGPEAHAFALLVVATVTLLTLEVGSFVESFGLGIPVKDRYLFYVTPLLVLAAAVALVSPRVPAAGVVAVTGFIVATVGWEEFGPVLGVNIDSPASATHERLTRLALELGLSASTLVAIGVGVVGPALVLALSALPRRAVATVVLAGIVAAVGLETGYTWARALGSTGVSGIALTARPTSANSWIDHAVPTGADVGMLPYAVSQDWFPSAIAWWNIEFWNARVTRAYLVGDWFTYTPDEFPRPRLRIDAQGRIVGNPPPFLVRTTVDARFAPAGVRVGSAPYLEVVRLEQPPRAAWVTRGLAPDGWTRPHVPAVLRVFGNGPVDVRIRLSAPGVKLPRTYEVGGARGALASNEFTDVSFRVCAHAHVDVPIHAQGTSAVRMIATRPPYADDFRFVGLRVSKIATAPANGSCSRNNTSKLR